MGWKFIILFAINLSLWGVPYTEEVLSGEFATYMYNIPGERTIRAGATQKELYTMALERVRKEAEEIFAGMIFGYRFTYIPGDKLRAVHDNIKITPIAQHLSGKLIPYAEQVQNGTLYIKFRYFLSAPEHVKRSAWEDSTSYMTTGKGKAKNQNDAFIQALRTAIRHYFRSLTASKPKRASGLLFLTDVPQQFFSEGLHGYTLSVGIYAATYDTYKVY